MAGAEERTHYQVLGVSRSASADEIRRAHRQLAQLLHPDRQGAAGPAERNLAERRMREVNAAWTVLSDPARRADYDRSLTAASRTSTTTAAGPRPAGTRPPASVRPEDSDDPDAALEAARRAELDDDEPDLGAAQFWLLRRGPLIAALVVAALLFVATAYAGSGTNQRPGDSSSALPLDPTADCVRLIEGRNAVGIDCGRENDGTIVARVDAALDCPAGSRYALLNNEFVCVRNGDGDGDTSTTNGGGG